MQHSGPGFARVDPLRGRVSSSLQSEVRKTINHKRSRGNLSAQQSTETGQLQGSVWGGKSWVWGLSITSLPLPWL